MKLFLLILFTFCSHSVEIFPKYITANEDISGSISISSTGNSTWNDVRVSNALSVVNATFDSIVAASFNTGTLMFDQDTNLSLGGGVNGLSIDGTTFSVDGSANMIGFGTAAPGSMFEMSSDSDVMGVEIRLTDTNVSGNQWGVRSDKGMFIIRDNSTGTNIFNINEGASGGVAIGKGVTAADRDLHVGSAIRIDPQSTAPSSPSTGDLYIDNTSGDALCVWLDGAWVKVDGTGTCS